MCAWFETHYILRSLFIPQRHRRPRQFFDSSIANPGSFVIRANCIHPEADSPSAHEKKLLNTFYCMLRSRMRIRDGVPRCAFLESRSTCRERTEIPLTLSKSRRSARFIPSSPPLSDLSAVYLPVPSPLPPAFTRRNRWNVEHPKYCSKNELL